FTWLSISLGPTFYGFGFALAVLLVVLAGCLQLSRTLELLEYETFMLQ
ncbi:MAG: histidine kinase, partial [Herbaspirillum sp.]|nr:histidine kinase [Herbaspirillum sp.]